MEESTSWVTYALIILAVLMVVGIMIYKFYPETFTDISKIAEEVFKFGEEAKNAEALQVITAGTIRTITECLEKPLDSCSCRLDMEALAGLPEGYKVFFQNRVDKTEDEEKKFVVVAAFDVNDAPVGDGASLENMQVSLAAAATGKEDGKDVAGIACRTLDPYVISITKIGEEKTIAPDTVFENLLLEKENGRVVLKAGKHGPYGFYDESIVQQIYRKGNNICFITKAIEDKGNAENSAEMGSISGNDFFISRMSPAEFARLPESADSIAQRVAVNVLSYLPFGGESSPVRIDQQTRVSGLMSGLLSIKNCQDRAGEDYRLIWPVETSKISSIEECGNNLDSPIIFQAFGIKHEPDFGVWVLIKTTEGSEVRVPVASGIVTDYCETNCGEKGMSITIYEYNPSTQRVTGRVVKISGIKALDEKYKKKAEVKTDGTYMGGVIVQSGEYLGESMAEVIFKEGIRDEISGSEDVLYSDYYQYFSGSITSLSITEARRSISRIICILPQLPEDYYKGKCMWKDFLAEDCKSPAKGSIYELADKASKLEINSAPQTMIFSFNLNNKKYNKLVIVPTERDIAPCSLGKCNVPYICPEGEICLCLKKGDNENYCAKIPAGGFKPVFAQASVNSDNNDIKKIWFQRVGNTLGICTTFPCITNGGIAIDSARQDAENKKNAEGRKEACRMEGGACKPLSECSKPTEKVGQMSCVEISDVCCIDLTKQRKVSAPDSKCEMSFKGSCRGTEVGCTDEELISRDVSGCPAGTECCVLRYRGEECGHSGGSCLSTCGSTFPNTEGTMDLGRKDCPKETTCCIIG